MSISAFSLLVSAISNFAISSWPSSGENFDDNDGGDNILKVDHAKIALQELILRSYKVALSFKFCESVS